MNKLEATTTLFKGTHFEVKKGEIIYWENSIYSEKLQSWTIAFYHKVNNEFEYFDRTTQMHFAREIQRMNDLQNTNQSCCTPGGKCC